MKFSPSGTKALGTRARLWERTRRWEQCGGTETPGTVRERDWRWEGGSGTHRELDENVVGTWERI